MDCTDWGAETGPEVIRRDPTAGPRNRRRQGGIEGTPTPEAKAPFRGKQVHQTVGQVHQEHDPVRRQTEEDPPCPGLRH